MSDPFPALGVAAFTLLALATFAAALWLTAAAAGLKVPFLRKPPGGGS